MSERNAALEQHAVRDVASAYRVAPLELTLDEVPPGYKRTEMGVIPEDWEVKSFSEILKRYNAKSSQIKASEYQDFGIFPVVDQGKQSVIGFTDNKDKVFSCPKAGVIIFGDHTCIVKYIDFDFSVGADGTQVLITKTNESTAFYAYQLQHRGVESTGYNRHFKFLKERAFLVPPVAERRAIVTALSDADALIESLNRLIAKKRAIKQATMQQLLTGQTRLPGFTVEWETKRLAAIGNFYKGYGIKRDDVTSEGVPCIRYGEIYTRYGDCVVAPESRVPERVAQSAFSLKSGDLLFAGSGETAEEIGMCVAYLGRQAAYAGGDIVILRPYQGNPAYLGRLLNHPSIVQQKARLGQGDAVVHISARNLAHIELRLPSEEEQSAISNLLFDMDTEIEALERRRDKARQIKQGMMQQLLTGRVRLVEPKVARAEVETKRRANKGHSKQFNEAVVISVLAKHFGTAEFPLGRKRYTKLSYLLHRHTDGEVEDYLKKAAGPYNPKTKYGGSEKIAVKKEYVREHKGPRGHSGFIAAENVAEAEGYFQNWYGSDAALWLSQFRFKSNDELEVLATVDMAARELRAAGRVVDVSSVKGVLQADSEWQSKLNRKVFSDESIAQAIKQSESLLRTSGKGLK